jgi:hypothetical protein
MKKTIYFLIRINSPLKPVYPSTGAGRTDFSKHQLAAWNLPSEACLTSASPPGIEITASFT